MPIGTTVVWVFWNQTYLLMGPRWWINLSSFICSNKNTQKYTLYCTLSRHGISGKHFLWFLFLYQVSHVCTLGLQRCFSTSLTEAQYIRMTSGKLHGFAVFLFISLWFLMKEIRKLTKAYIGVLNATQFHSYMSVPYLKWKKHHPGWLLMGKSKSGLCLSIYSALSMPF